MIRRYWLTILILALTSLMLFSSPASAATVKSTFPRLANYFLHWEITDAHVAELAKWDLLILDMEVQENSRAQLLEIRRRNPKVVILAYITSQEIYDDVKFSNLAPLRRELSDKIIDSWWLRDSRGNRIVNWPENHMLNLSDGAGTNSSGQRFNDILPEFIAGRIQASGLWDGVFYDNTWGDIHWLKPDLDLNNDGVPDSRSEADRLWEAGFMKMLQKTRRLTGPDFIIIGNGRVHAPYQEILNGMMLESFPSPWENGGNWQGSMQSYLRLPSQNASPQVSVINVNVKSQTNYSTLRFGLASALMGSGYYSYDYDITDHGQLWWYDEYNVKLGPAQSPPYNLLANNSLEIKEGLWRRDFRNGVAILNSTNQKQTYVLKQEELEKIAGTQDVRTNSGERVNYVQLDPQDGILLLKRNKYIVNGAFTNGYFYRVFLPEGRQKQGGFFSYSEAFPGEAAVIMASGSLDDERDINLSAHAGQVKLLRDGRLASSFYPYANLYRRELSLAARLSDGYVQKIVTGPGVGGGPQVRVFHPDGRVEASFFAYDERLRNGVNVALGDVDGDGVLEIVTGPGPGEVPTVKIFTVTGRLLGSFLAYDPLFRGGVKVALGDLDGDGRDEIVTAPAGSGGPHVRIWDGSGQPLSSFFAYDASYRGGLKLTVSDIDGDGLAEIFAGVKNIF